MSRAAPSRPLTATLALLGATAIWGGTFVTVKDALSAADTFTFLALRFSVGALVAAALAARAPGGLGSRRVLRPGLVLGGLLFGGYLLQTLGLETSSPARSAFITGLTVIFVPFVAWALSRKRPPTRAFVAPFVALFGLQRLTGVSFDGPLPVGDVLTLGCAVLYAFHIVATSRLGEGLPSMALTSVQLGVVALLSGASLPFVERRFEPTPAFWFAVAFTGVLASAVAIGVQVWAQKELSAVRAAVIYALEPVFALLVAALSGLGLPSPAELLGGAFILAAVLISEVELPALKRALNPRSSP
ncbi:MAG: DMT family transporter [Myxococcota bacterium]